MALKYQGGFGNTFSTEAEPGALPVGQNSPQKTPRGLYPEVLSGSAFTAPRAENLSSWLYRIRPTAMHGPFKRVADGLWRSGPLDEVEASPNRLRWNPLPLRSKPTDFLDGLVTIAGSGDAASQAGIAVHVYCANRSMKDRFFYSLLMAEVTRVHQFVTFTVHTPAQFAFAEFLSRDPSAHDLAAFYQGKRDQFLSLTAGSRFTPLACEGTYFQLMDYSAISDDGDTVVAEWLLKTHGVAAIPVSAFLYNDTGGPVLRFCFAKKDETLSAAAERLTRV